MHGEIHAEESACAVEHDVLSTLDPIVLQHWIPYRTGKQQLSIDI